VGVAVDVIVGVGVLVWVIDGVIVMVGVGVDVGYGDSVGVAVCVLVIVSVGVYVFEGVGVGGMATSRATLSLPRIALKFGCNLFVLSFLIKLFLLITSLIGNIAIYYPRMFNPFVR
jgi:hypothetical protein